MSFYSQDMVILDMRFSAQVTAAEFAQWLQHIAQYLTQQRHFVLVMQSSVDASFPSDYRAVQSTWYKQHKADFFQYCLGLVRITQTPEEQIRLDTPALHKAWHVPYFVTCSKTEAFNWAMQRYLCRV